MYTILIVALTLTIFILRLQTILSKNLNIVLTFENVNTTKLGLILNQNLLLSKCPSNNYTINFIPFNITPLYQTPIGVNNFDQIHLVFGPDRYFGPTFFAFSGTNADFVFKSAFYSSFSLDFGTRFSAILAVVNSSLATDNVKAVTFVMNGSSVDTMEPWKTFNAYKYLTLFRGSLTTLYYYNSSDAVRIASEIISRGITNIVLDLNYNASLLVLKACNDRNLLNWKQRWMIFFSTLPYKNLASIVLPLSSNFTMFDFGRIGEFSSYYIDEESDVYFYDICYTIVKLLDYQNCNQTLPNVMNLGTGTFTFTNNEIQRSSWVFQAFQSNGSINRVGNVTLGLNNSVSINIPVIQNLLNRSTTQILTEMRSKSFRVAAMIEPPFVFTDANGVLTGYSVETINLILKNLNLNGVITAYNLSTGTLENGKFSGILGILQNGLADIAIGPITYFAKYSNYINFTTQFKSYQLAIIYNVPPSNQYQEMFEFITAFSYPVWILIVGSCFVYAGALTVVNLISPNKEKMGILDTFFFTMGSMVQGVTTALPDKVSGRILVIFWWILNIAILLAYVANYGANRTSSKLQSTIRDESDLHQQTRYTYGTVINSSVDEYLASSQSQTIQQINSKMRTVFLGDMGNSTKACLNTVQSKYYAFIYDDAVLNQYMNIKCLTLTGGFDPLYYAYALLDSDYTTIINTELNTLISSGVLTGLDAKYFTTVTQPPCMESNWLGILLNALSYEFLVNRVDSLTIPQTSGIFIIMLIGVIVSLVVAVVEFIVRKYCKKHSDTSESNA